MFAAKCSSTRCIVCAFCMLEQKGVLQGQFGSNCSYARKKRNIKFTKKSERIDGLKNTASDCATWLWQTVVVGPSWTPTIWSRKRRIAGQFWSKKFSFWTNLDSRGGFNWNRYEDSSVSRACAVRSDVSWGLMRHPSIRTCRDAKNFPSEQIWIPERGR